MPSKHMHLGPGTVAHDAISWRATRERTAEGQVVKIYS
jgi:hypothetical protein